MRESAFVVTGEGKIDDQTLQGKIVGEVATRCRQGGVPCHVVVGKNAIEPFNARVLDLASITEAGTRDALRDAGRTSSGATDHNAHMAGRYGASVVIDRPIDEVFAFLADGYNDKKFSPRVLEIEKTTDGPPGVGTVYASTVKDAGVKTRREFEYTEFEQPTKIRWSERSKNMITVPRAAMTSSGGDGTKLTFFNEFEPRPRQGLLRRPAGGAEAGGRLRERDQERRRGGRALLIATGAPCGAPVLPHSSGGPAAATGATSSRASGGSLVLGRVLPVLTCGKCYTQLCARHERGPGAARPPKTLWPLPSLCDAKAPSAQLTSIEKAALNVAPGSAWRRPSLASALVGAVIGSKQMKSWSGGA